MPEHTQLPGEGGRGKKEKEGGKGRVGRRVGRDVGLLFARARASMPASLPLLLLRSDPSKDDSACGIHYTPSLHLAVLKLSLSLSSPLPVCLLAVE